MENRRRRNTSGNYQLVLSYGTTDFQFYINRDHYGVYWAYRIDRRTRYKNKTKITAEDYLALMEDGNQIFNDIFLQGKDWTEESSSGQSGKGFPRMTDDSEEDYDRPKGGEDEHGFEIFDDEEDK